MINEALEWTVERFRKGIEFEIESSMVKGAAEVCPHLCVMALGVTLTQAQIGLGAAILGAGGVWYIVHRRKRRRSELDALAQVAAKPTYSDCD